MAVLLPLQLGIWEGRTTHVPHHRYLEVMLFANAQMLVAIPMVATPVPMAIPMAIPTLAIRAEMTAVAIKEAQVAGTILKIRVWTRMI